MCPPDRHGTTVVITSTFGTTLDTVDEVLFGGLPGTGLVHPTDNQIVVQTPPQNSARSVDVELSENGVVVPRCPGVFRYF